MFIETKPKEIIPAGVYTGTLYSIIDLGTQKIVYNEDPKLEHRIRLDWEITEEKMLDGRPFAIGKEFKASLHEKSKLYALIKTWLTKAPEGKFNLSELLGKSGNLAISHTTKGDKTYANLDAVTPLKKNEKAPEPINPLREFDLANYKGKIFEELPDFLKEKIRLSPEYAELGKKPEPSNHDAPIELPDDESIPF